mmetsp:Transcript_21462/g.49997  ORF Transcript_21462/g.49997 Transcript_21462/m.49997 type:complete len:251 (+) Transcript_21462:1549-2301(+)
MIKQRSLPREELNPLLSCEKRFTMWWRFSPKLCNGSHERSCMHMSRSSLVKVDARGWSFVCFLRGCYKRAEPWSAVVAQKRCIYGISTNAIATVAAHLCSSTRLLGTLLREAQLLLSLLCHERIEATPARLREVIVPFRLCCVTLLSQHTSQTHTVRLLFQRSSSSWRRRTNRCHQLLFYSSPIVRSQTEAALAAWQVPIAVTAAKGRRGRVARSFTSLSSQGLGLCHSRSPLLSPSLSCRLGDCHLQLL